MGMEESPGGARRLLPSAAGEVGAQPGNVDTWILFLGQGRIQPPLPPSFRAGGSRGGERTGSGWRSPGPADSPAARSTQGLSQETALLSPPPHSTRPSPVFYGAATFPG